MGYISFFVFILALVLILKGGELLVEASVWFARKTAIPPMVVGATIVAIATTFPETSVSIISGIKGAQELAVNTALGAMICNFALVLGLSFICKPSCITKESFITKAIFFTVSLVVLFIVSLDGKLGLVDALIMLSIFVLFIISSFNEAKKESTEILEMEQSPPGWIKIVIQFFISAMAVGYGANAIVSNVESLSQLVGISEGILGLLVVSIGTNIPEFVTTISSIKLNNADIGIGNIFGSSIIDSTMLIALTILASKQKQVSIPIGVLLLTFFALVLVTAVIVFPILKRGKSNRLQGFFLIVIFICYSLLMYKIS